METVFQSISLADSVSVTTGGAGGARIRLTVEGADVGPERENLAWRAASRFVEAFAPGLAVSIRLDKRIPAGAGLGGGSSDAAAVLRCLSALTDFDDVGQLAAIGAALGSDVPFFLGPTGRALGRGRGEVLEPLDPLPVRPVVLALPPVHVSTVDAYAALGASRSAASGDGIEAEPHGGPRDLDPGRLGDWTELDLLAENDFGALIAARHPEIAQSTLLLEAAGASVTLLSGSGGACFGLFESVETAGGAAADLSAATGWPFLACSTLGQAPAVEGLREG